MKKISYLFISLNLLINISACAGYKPIFSSSNLKFKIADYSIIGDKKLGNQIYSKLYNLSKSAKDDQNIRSINLVIKVSKDKSAKSKDNAGKILDYKITLNTEVKIADFITKDEILNQTFSSSLIYKVQNQHSDTIKLENKSIEDLVNKTYQELYIRLSENIASK